MKESQDAANQTTPIWKRLVDTAAARVLIECTPQGVCRVRFLDTEGRAATMPPQPSGPAEPAWVRRVEAQVRQFLEGRRVDFTGVPIDLSGQPTFRRAVLYACRKVPYGQTVTYAELARRVGRHKAARAVGGSMSRNPLPIIIPCHRVLPRSGGLGGFSAPGGVQVKQRLLAMERAALERSASHRGPIGR